MPSRDPLARERTVARILLIDDDEGIRTILNMALNTAGHEVTEAAEGTEGLKLYATGEFDVVITDLIMPGREGLEMIRELRKSWSDARIIAMSGGDSHGFDYLASAARFGARRVLKKPFDLQTLLEAVDAALADDS